MRQRRKRAVIRDHMTALSRLLSLLDLAKTGENGFEGLSPSEPVQRVFGGQVLAQVLVAARPSTIWPSVAAMTASSRSPPR